MVDHISLLEERVENLIQNLDRTLRANEELRRRSAELDEEVEKMKKGQATLEGNLNRVERQLESTRGELIQAREQNAAFQAEVTHLRGELESTAGREEVIRDRLQGILEKIDSIEQEFNVAQRTE